MFKKDDLEELRNEIAPDYFLMLDDMTHEERSIFFYHFILGLSRKIVAQKLKMSNRIVNRVCSQIKGEMKHLHLKTLIIQSILTD